MSPTRSFYLQFLLLLGVSALVTPRHPKSVDSKQTVGIPCDKINTLKKGEPLWRATNVIYEEGDGMSTSASPMIPHTPTLVFNMLLDLDLYNAVLNATIECKGVILGPDRINQITPVPCTSPWSPEGYPRETTVLLLRDSNNGNTTATLQVNDTWYCDQERQKKPVQVTTQGTAIVGPLDCKSLAYDYSPFWPSWIRWTNCSGPDTNIFSLGTAL